ncbi:hypothetical protein [Anaerosporobacter sp.]
MENVILVISVILLLCLALLLIIKPIYFYKIQQKVMALFQIRVEYDEENMTMGRVVGIILLIITTLATLMQFS